MPLTSPDGALTLIPVVSNLDYNLPKIEHYNVSDAGAHYRLCGRPVDSDAHFSNLLLTMLLACVFLGVKWIEYGHKFHAGLIPGVAWDPPADAPNGLRLFFGLYFAMSGMHALHIIVGLVLMVFVALRSLRGRYSPQNYIGVEILGLYWHFVDLVWIFLFPLLYLLNRHVGAGH